EGVDVGEGRVAHAGGRAAVVHQLAHIAAALAHALEPGLNEGAQIGSLRAQPRVDLGIVLHRGGEAKDVVAGHLATSRRARATVSARSAGPPPPRRAPAGPRASGRPASRAPRTGSARAPRAGGAPRDRTRRSGRARSTRARASPLQPGSAAPAPP